MTSGGRVLIVAGGTRGDVAPYTGLGVRLQAAGYHVVVATHHPFAGWRARVAWIFAACPAI